MFNFYIDGKTSSSGSLTSMTNNPHHNLFLNCMKQKKLVGVKIGVSREKILCIGVHGGAEEIKQAYIGAHKRDRGER